MASSKIEKSVFDVKPTKEKLTKLSSEKNFQLIDTSICRLCVKKSVDQFEVFGSAGIDRNISQKVKECLPVVISEDDDLPKSMCSDCYDQLDIVYSFFKKCINSTQQLIADLRSTRENAIDLTSHVNQYVRSFNPPAVPRFNVKVLKLSSKSLDDGFVIEKSFPLTSSDIPDLENIETIVEIQNEDETVEVAEDKIATSYIVNEDDLKKLPKIFPKRRKQFEPKRYNPDGSVFDPFFDDPEKALDKKPSRKELACKVRKPPSPSALFSCSKCSKAFNTHSALLIHWEQTHPNEKVLYLCFENDVDTGERCNFQTHTDSNYLSHVLEHRNRPSSEKDFKCKVCFKAFPQSCLLDDHMSIHSVERNFKCRMCEKDFKTEAHLKTHIKSHEPEETKRTFCCELCGKRFSQRASLDTHLRVHSGEKPFLCDICDKSFAHKGNMEEHRRVHTGERPYVCELCGATFKRAGEIKMHLRVAHTGDRPYKCSFCDKTFQYSNLLKRHELIHAGIRPHSCPHCGKSFTQRDKMLVHTRLHTGERPYVCNICQKGFCESGNLRKHIKVHGKIPPPIVHQNNKGQSAP